MYCKKCGKDNPNEAVFCKTCGAPMKDESPAENVPLNTQPLGAASTLDYNNPEPPKPAGPAPVLHHYESRGKEPVTTAHSHPRSYSPSYSAPAPTATSYAPPSSTLTLAPMYNPYEPPAPVYYVPSYMYRTVAVPTYAYRTVAVPTYTEHVVVVPTWKYW